MHTRREFMIDSLGATAATWSAFRVPAASIGQDPIRIDGLGEIRLDYEPELLDEILASGLRGCAVTVGNPALQGATAFEDMKAEIEAYDRHIQSQPTRLSTVKTTADLDRAKEQNTLGLLYYTQNASPIEDDIDRLKDLYDLGVRIVQLTYNTRNLLGDGCLERTNTGLSRFGLEVVERMNAMNMLIDVSHCGPATTLEGIRFSSKPVAITHSGCKAVFDHPRNKTDEAIGALANRGGVIGIYQINPYLGPKERNTLDDYLDHIDHAIDVAGIDCVGIGSDREHRTIPDTEEEKQKLVEELSRLRPVTADTVQWPFFLSELNHPRRMETIVEALHDRGRTVDEVHKLMGGNFYRLFKETIG